MVVEGGAEFSVSKFPAEADAPLMDDCESCLGRDAALNSLVDSSSYKKIC